MELIRRAEDRGVANLGWLNSRHTFSFGTYYDPKFMGFGSLRVINEDRVQPGKGFGTHGHQDMEIISYVLDGELRHEDSMGNGSVIRRGDVQRMTAGTGIRHSEFNNSATDPVHFLQIWILPAQLGLAPGYQQVHYPLADKLGSWRLIASPDGHDGSVTVHQDVRISAAVLRAGESAEYSLANTRMGWLHIASGAAVLNGNAHLTAGDGIPFYPGSCVDLSSESGGEFLLFDMKR